MSRWVFLAAGTSRGEAAFCAPFARAAAAAGRPVQVITDRRENARLFEGLPCQILSLSAAAHQLREDDAIRVLSNSLTLSPLALALRGSRTPLVSVEYTWIPWVAEAPELFEGIDAFLFAHPEEVFQAGLASQGGPFSLPDSLRSRIHPVGWPFSPPPSQRKPLPRVLVYGGANPGFFSRSEGSLWEALEHLRHSRAEFQVELIAPPGEFPESPAWVERADWLPPEEFAARVASASLLICHHGMATIAQACVAGTPVCALSDGSIFQSSPGKAWADRELYALSRLGLVDPIPLPLPPEGLARRILSHLEAVDVEAPRQGGPGRGFSLLEERARLA